VRDLVLSALAVLCLGPPGAAQRPRGDTTDLFLEALVDERPAVLWAPRRTYPDALRQAGIEGRVLVQAIIDTMGRAEPGTVKVVQSPNPGFDRNATEYVRKVVFRPARIHGRTVRVLVQVPVEFRLPGR